MSRLVLVLLAAGCGRLGFGAVDGDAATELGDGSPTIPPANFGGQVGRAECGQTSNTIVVSQPVPAGSRLIASIVLRSSTATGPTQVFDSAGSQWVLDHERQGTNGLHVAVWSTPLSMTLDTGVAITAQFPDAIGSSLVVDVLSGVTGVAGSGDGQGSSKGWRVDTSPISQPALVYCALGDHNYERTSISWVATADYLAMCSMPGPGVRVGPAPEVSVEPTAYCAGTFRSKTSWTAVAIAYATE